MVYYSGGTPQTVLRFSGYKRRLSESWWAVEVETHAENCFLTGKSYPSLLNRFFPSIDHHKKQEEFQVNSKIQQINTRQHANLHQPSVNATKYQKEVHCIAVKVCNMLPFYIKAESDNSKKFKALLKKYLRENLFYSLDEYFERQVKFWHVIWIDT